MRTITLIALPKIPSWDGVKQNTFKGMEFVCSHGYV